MGALGMFFLRWFPRLGQPHSAPKKAPSQILRENGYNTFAFGKWGKMPDADSTDAGPFDRWPSGSALNISTISWDRKRDQVPARPHGR